MQQQHRHQHLNDIHCDRSDLAFVSSISSSYFCQFFLFFLFLIWVWGNAGFTLSLTVSFFFSFSLSICLSLRRFFRLFVRCLVVAAKAAGGAGGQVASQVPCPSRALARLRRPPQQHLIMIFECGLNMRPWWHNILTT